METIKIRQNTDKLLTFIAQKFDADELDNTSLIELFQLSGSYLNLMTIPQYAKKHSMTYEGVRKCRKIEVLFGVRFVVEND